jgi:hypothetical protein
MRKKKPPPEAGPTAIGAAAIAGDGLKGRDAT